MAGYADKLNIVKNSKTALVNVFLFKTKKTCPSTSLFILDKIPDDSSNRIRKHNRLKNSHQNYIVRTYTTN